MEAAADRLTVHEYPVFLRLLPKISARFMIDLLAFHFAPVLYKRSQDCRCIRGQCLLIHRALWYTLWYTLRCFTHGGLYLKIRQRLAIFSNQCNRFRQVFRVSYIGALTVRSDGVDTVARLQIEATPQQVKIYYFRH